MRSIVFLVIVSLSVLFLFPQYTIAAGIDLVPYQQEKSEEPLVFDWNPRVQAAYQEFVSNGRNIVMYKTVTGYSSTVSQTDSTPFIAASGQRVFNGMIASNFLPFGTKVKMPELFGDKVFIVGDRMHERFSDRIDVWFDNTTAAEKFGKRFTKVVVVES